MPTRIDPDMLERDVERDIDTNMEEEFDRRRALGDPPRDQLRRGRTARTIALFIGPLGAMGGLRDPASYGCEMFFNLVIFLW
eukprot:gene25097-58821_t